MAGESHQRHDDKGNKSEHLKREGGQATPARQHCTDKGHPGINHADFVILLHHRPDMQKSHAKCHHAKMAAVIQDWQKTRIQSCDRSNAKDQGQYDEGQ